MKTKIPLALGALVIITILCKFLDVMELIIRDNLYDPSKVSNITATIVGIVAIIYSIGSIIFGIWMALNPSKIIEPWNKPFNFSVSIPRYFLFALGPIVTGMLLFFFTNQMIWLSILGGMSFLSIIIFLSLAIKNSSN
jgi:hypothetical protein